MDMNNLPKINKKPNIANRFFNQISTKQKNRQIINNFKEIKQYDVLSMPAFRLIVDEMIKKDPNGTLIMTDINDLFVANQNRGKREVNTLIAAIIESTKKELVASNCSNYQMGKMGDEIYIYIQDKNETETADIVNALGKIKKDELTMSAGSSSDFSMGLISAMNMADKKMTINKANFKADRLKETCGENLDKIIDIVVSTHIDKMRLNLANLKEANRSDIKNTYTKAVNNLDINQLINSSKSKTDQNFSNDKSDSFSNLKRQYYSEAYLMFGDNEKAIEEYILASIISKHAVPGVISSEFFQGMENKAVAKKVFKDKAPSFELFSIDLSGLKAINDTAGHEEGDAAIFDVLEYFNSSLKSLDIKQYSDIIAKGGGNSYVFIEKLPEDKKAELQTLLSNYSNQSKYNISIMSASKTIEKSEVSKRSFLKVSNSHLTEIETNLQNQSFVRKLNDVGEIQNCIKNIYKQIINLNDIQFLANNTDNLHKNVFERVNSAFKEYIEKERSPEVKSSEIVPLKDIPKVEKCKRVEEKHK